LLKWATFVSFKNYFSGSFYLFMYQFKKHILRVIFFSSIVTSLTGCITYEPLKIQVLSPAQKDVASDIYKVVLVNHCVYEKSVKNITQENTLNFDSVCTDQYLEGLLQILRSSPRFQLVEYPYLFIKKSSFANRFKKFSWEEIEKICADSSADAAIVLENYQVTYTDPIKLNYNSEYGFYGNLQVENNSLWKIYNLRSRDFADDYVLQDTLFWDASGNYDFEVYNQLPEISDAVLQSCFYAGFKYGERIAQTWATKRRYILSCEIFDFITAADLAKKGEWTKAIEIWKKYPYGKKKRLAAFASYNLAVACETLDNIDAALDWAAKSYFLRKDSYTESYISTLEKRKEEKKLIEKQLK
jgi:hypothetical protein